MSEPNGEARELLLGTWTGVALLADALIRCGVVGREEVIRPLADAEALARDRRSIAITAIRTLIGELTEPTCRPRGCRRRLR